MKKLIISLVVGVLLIGCSAKEKTPILPVQIEQKSNVSTFVSGLYIVTDVHGYKYKQFSPSYKSNGLTYFSLWERIDPPVTNRWYTPSLSTELMMNRHESDGVYLFNSIQR